MTLKILAYPATEFLTGISDYGFIRPYRHFLCIVNDIHRDGFRRFHDRVDTNNAGQMLRAGTPDDFIVIYNTRLGIVYSLFDGFERHPMCDCSGDRYTDIKIGYTDEI